MSWNSHIYGLLAEERISRFLKEAAGDQRVAEAAARQTVVRAVPRPVTRTGLLRLIVRTLVPARRREGAV